MNNDSSFRDKTQVWLNCEDPEKGNMNNNSSLGGKTQVYLNCEDPENGIMVNDNKLGDKTQVWLNCEDPENINEPEVYPRRSLVASESLKEPKVYSRRNFVATDFLCQPEEVAEDSNEPKFYNEVPEDLNSYLDLDLRSNSYLEQGKKIEAENAIANDEDKTSGKNPEVDSFEFPNVDLELEDLFQT